MTETYSYIVAGHSHAAAFGVPFGHVSKPTLVPLYSQESLPVRGLATAYPSNEDYWDALVQESENKTVILLWAGNTHLVHFLFAPDPLFDFHVASRPDLMPIEGVKLVPEALFREILRQDQDHLGELLARLNKVKGCRTIVCGTPPPKEPNAKLRANLQKETYFVSVAAQNGFELGSIALTPPQITLHMWATMQDLWREIAETSGNKFIAVPSFALNDQGLLAEEYWSGDATHANLEYGKKFLAHVLQVYSGTR